MINRNGGLQLLACAVDPQLRSCTGCTVAINGQAVFCIIWSRAVQEDELYECESMCVDVHVVYMCRHVYICGDWLEGKIFSDTIKIAGQFVYAPGRW